MQNTDQQLAQEVKASLWAISLKHASGSNVGPWLQASAFLWRGGSMPGCHLTELYGTTAIPWARLRGAGCHPGGTVTVDGYLILLGIVTPAHPNGHPAVPGDLSLGLDQTQVIKSTSSNWVDGPITVGIGGGVQVPDTAKRIPLSAVAP